MLMKTRSAATLYLFLAVVFCSASPNVFAQDYEALKGLKSANAIVDFRMGKPDAVVPTMKLVHQTYKDLAAMQLNPDFVVVFIGPSVKLITKNREGFQPEDRKNLDELAKTITAMSRDGIRFEICLAAAHAFKVDPAAVLPEIRRVGNGWISEIGYQARGYSLVPVF